MNMFIVRSFFGGELIATTVTPAASLEAAKKNFMAWADPRVEAVTVEPCHLGQDLWSGFWAVQEGIAVAYSTDFLVWKSVEEEPRPIEWSRVVSRIIC